MEFDHAGIATADAAETAALFTDLLGAENVHEETDENRGMRFVFLDLGNGYLELIEPLGDGGSIATYLESDGPGIHHLAFATDDASAALDRARESGIQTLDDEPRPGAWGHDIAFLHPRDTAGVLVEFVEH
ncbi:methylmalonyl-CoA epimerase [Halolamina sp.]|jgi:methylmalonyl-CoA epimerase (EC 5.1.99.1)|uniref:methylmalonyl-CoA epimerase n=1 Tax=Halolamina sp. TaxID=1940283 RepID=UPI000223B7C7|nr:methylmalonyl-CoA epimerase [halophilic archaeon DL31]